MTVSTRRFRHLMLAGVSDSFCLSFGWTVIMIQLAESDGLGVAGLVSAAMLLGIALSAPVATFAAARMSGRRLLRSAASVEALLRVLMFACLVAQVATAVLVACVIVLNVIAWTGYAAMRAEVAAVSPGSGALTWYATSVAAIEAFAAAAAALMSAALDLDLPLAMVVVVVVYVSGLIPTFIVARYSDVPRAERIGLSRDRTTSEALLTPPIIYGALLMLISSSPTILAVGLATQLHGPSSVAVIAAAFTIGSLLAPLLSRWSQRNFIQGPRLWLLLAAGAVAGWILAPLNVMMMAAAQVASGLFMTSLEGLLDADTVRRTRHGVTGALARGSATRAVGSAGSTAVLPLLVAGVGLSGAALGLTCLLLAGAVFAGVRSPFVRGCGRVRGGTRQHGVNLIFTVEGGDCCTDR